MSTYCDFSAILLRLYWIRMKCNETFWEYFRDSHFTASLFMKHVETNREYMRRYEILLRLIEINWDSEIFLQVICWVVLRYTALLWDMLSCIAIYWGTLRLGAFNGSKVRKLFVQLCGTYIILIARLYWDSNPGYFKTPPYITASI
jgi:hypothetical protein